MNITIICMIISPILSYFTIRNTVKKRKLQKTLLIFSISIIFLEFITKILKINFIINIYNQIFFSLFYLSSWLLAFLCFFHSKKKIKSLLKIFIGFFAFLNYFLCSFGILLLSVVLNIDYYKINYLNHRYILKQNSISPVGSLTFSKKIIIAKKIDHLPLSKEIFTKKYHNLIKFLYKFDSNQNTLYFFLSFPYQKTRIDTVKLPDI